LRVFKAGLVP